MSFKNAKFNQGDKGENRIIDLLKNFEIEAAKPVPYNKYYDLLISLNKEYKGEVKSDLMGKQTGNIALEFWNSKKNEPSGLSSTLADIWFHIFCDEVWIANTLELKLYVQNVQPLKIIFSGGDKNANLYIYKADKIFKDIFTRIDNIETKHGKKTILNKVGND